MKKLVFAVCFLFVLNQLTGQELRFSLGFQYGTYDMSEMKKDQRQLLRDWDFFDLRTDESFSSSFGLNGTITYSNDNRLGGGIEFGSSSTSAKIRERGNAFQIAHHAWAPNFGVTTFYMLNDKSKPYEIMLHMNGGVLLNRLRIKYKSAGIVDEPETAYDRTYRYGSTSFYASAGPGINYKAEHWFISFKVLYLHEFAPNEMSATHYPDPSTGAPNASTLETGLNWSGIRISLAVGPRLRY